MDSPRTIEWVIWGCLGLVALRLAALFVARERREFVTLGRGGAWLWLRLWTVPILLVSALSVLVPAYLTHGPEALAVLYGLLFTLGPLLYFLLHGWLGRLAKPALTRGESNRIALSGLALVIVPALAAQMAQMPVYLLARQLEEVYRSSAPSVPSPYRVVEQRRFEMPGAGVIWYEHWQAPAGVITERVERPVDRVYVRADDPGSTTLCRDGADVHVFWPADLPLPAWRIDWRDAAGKRHRSPMPSQPPTVAPEAFTVGWLETGVRLPVPVPRSIVSIDRSPEGSPERYDSIALAMADLDGERCLPRDYVPPSGANADAPIRAFSLRFWNRTTQTVQFSRWQRETQTPPM